MRYFLYEEQEGGCGYTIGCGRRLREIEGAANLADAARLAAEVRLGKYGETESMLADEQSERRPDRARILAVAVELEIDLSQVYACRRELQDKALKLSEEAAERAELERLRQKYEG